MNLTPIIVTMATALFILSIGQANAGKTVDDA